MLEETKIALRALRASKKLELDRSKFEAIMNDLRAFSNEQLWLALEPPKKRPAKPADPLAARVKRALAKFKAPAATKAQRLVLHLIPDRETPPRTMAAALKLLRQYFEDDDIGNGAEELMRKLLDEGGMGVTL